jgi:hypothetical protein
LPKTPEGAHADFPSDPALVRFDLADRKFAALSRRERIPVVTATDRGWVRHRNALEANGVTIEFVCGCEPKKWFVT